MSIIWTLRKLTDSIEHREQQAAQERDRRLARRQGLGDGEEDGPTAAREQQQKTYECRVCGHRSTDKRYCPDCLADTMDAVSEDD